MDTTTLLLMAVLSFCPISFLLGVGITAIGAYVLMQRTKKIWHHHTEMIKAREWNGTIRPLLDEGWIVDGVTPGDVNGFVDVHMRRWM